MSRDRNSTAAKVVFLEIDCVLLTPIDWRAPGNLHACDVFDASGEESFGLARALRMVVLRHFRIRLLNELCSDTGAAVVLLSRWLPVVGSEVLSDLLTRNSVYDWYLHRDVACTVTDPESKRAAVEGWLSRHREVREWIVLDADAAELGFEDPVPVHPRLGFTITEQLDAVHRLRPRLPERYKSRHPDASAIVFLDIDGVLLPTACWSLKSAIDAWQRLRWCTDESERELIYTNDVQFSAVAIALMNQLCTRCRAQIVLVTSWRWHHSQEYIRRILSSHGVAEEHWHADYACVDTGGGKRADVDEWLSRHAEVTAWVVVDDQSGELGFADLGIDGEQGLTISSYRRACELLGAPVGADEHHAFLGFPR
ncbi:hypothetical protein FHR90_003328 [Endobacter medicaginis]|uniref:Uncharacterized protein n=1 Tax=Endobacter medicaginis TaxID=1181271 RepID=A0A839V7E8_9PROT|nr:HAD domain-containing protein [Endobacter medicaginis]MBB3175472.1 hypothetical protein [Endobacter medicaginis]MCX5477136.1 HAD domain-containing protein [Endobacter medicaginis]NVN29819.1 hypothetical protein [Endobacter medicaginis]